MIILRLLGAALALGLAIAPATAFATPDLLVTPTLPLTVVVGQSGLPGDFLLTNAKPTGVRACKLAWRSDGRELVVVQADEACGEEVGALVRLPVADPKQQTELNASGDNPAFQPLTLGQ